MKSTYAVGRLGIAIAIAIMAFVPTFAKGGHGGRGGGDRVQKLIKKLDLTADQQTRIKAIRDQFKQENAGTLQEMKNLREQMKEYKRSDNTAQAQALREQMKAKAQTLQAARQRMMEQIKAVLTPEQQAKVQQMMEEHKGKGGKGKGKGKRGRGQGQEQQGTDNGRGDLK